MTILPPYARAADALDAMATERLDPALGVASVQAQTAARDAFVALAASLSVGSVEHTRAVTMAQLHGGETCVGMTAESLRLAAQRWRDRGARR